MTSNQAAELVVKVFDGTRRSVPDSLELSITITDGNLKRVVDHRQFKGSNHAFEVDFFDNQGDNYIIFVNVGGYKDGGCQVKVSNKRPTEAAVMLLPTHGRIQFPNGDWATLRAKQPNLFDLLSYGVTEGVAESRYGKRLQEHPEIIAAFMNITTAMKAIELANGNVLQYFKGVLWDEMQQDRFFGYADQALVDDVVKAAADGEFEKEPNPGSFHPGATRSYKQVEFAEANVQLTFHERDDAPKINSVDCVKVEADIDYYRDLVAHGFGEVLPNTITHGLTDPEKVYVLRWTVGMEGSLPEFDPPYIIA